MVSPRKRRRVRRLISAYARVVAQQEGVSPAAEVRAWCREAYDADGVYPVRCGCGCWGWRYSR